MIEPIGKTLLPAAAFLLLLAGCSREKSQEPAATPAETAPAPLPAIRTLSDSLAMRVYEGVGGPGAWASVRYVRFDFAQEQNGVRTLYRKNLWDRAGHRYRLEWAQGGDSTYVVVLNTDSREGNAYLNGRAVSADGADSLLVARAYFYFVNDTYWLAAPMKLLDPGVFRLHLPGWSDESADVFTTTYEQRELAPDDQFWFWVDKTSGKLLRWAYVRNSNPDAGPIIYEWGDYESFDTPEGTVKFMPRKKGPVGDVLTDNISLPATVDEGTLLSPRPQL